MLRLNVLLGKNQNLGSMCCQDHGKMPGLYLPLKMSKSAKLDQILLDTFAESC